MPIFPLIALALSVAPRSQEPTWVKVKPRSMSRGIFPSKDLTFFAQSSSDGSMMTWPGDIRPSDLRKVKALRNALDSVCGGFHGAIGYSIDFPGLGVHISREGDERFPTASTIKTAVAVHVISRVEEGTLKMSDKRVVPPMSGRQASMWSYSFRDGVKLDVDGWMNLMLTVSDNTATMVLREWMGMNEINARMAKLGLKNTKVLGPYPPSDVPNYRLRTAFGLGVTTPNEMTRLFRMIYDRKAMSEAGCEKLMRILSHQYWDDMAMSSVPLGIQVCCKSGAINRSRSEAAIVFAPEPYIFSIYTDNQKDQSWNDANEGEVAIRKMCGFMWNVMNPNRPYKLPSGYEKFMPTGGGVSDS